MNKQNRVQITLYLGDALALFFATMIGYLAHNYDFPTMLTRMLPAFVPWAAMWLLVGLMIKAFDPIRASDPRRLWRPVVGIVLTAPIAAGLRAAWLQTPVVPVFVGVMAAVTGVAILAWRILYWLVTQRRETQHG